MAVRAIWKLGGLFSVAPSHASGSNQTLGTRQADVSKGRLRLRCDDLSGASLSKRIGSKRKQVTFFDDLG
jgi:hypothetical protein